MQKREAGVLLLPPFLLYHYKLGDDHESDDEPEAPNNDDISDDNDTRAKMVVGIGIVLQRSSPLSYSPGGWSRLSTVPGVMVTKCQL